MKADKATPMECDDVRRAFEVHSHTPSSTAAIVVCTGLQGRQDKVCKLSTQQ
jgi:hypothetical protein